MKQISLNGTWNLYYFEQGKHTIKTPNDLINQNLTHIPCTVPGNVELDLSVAGILPSDLYLGENIVQVQEYESYEWWYVTSFSAPDFGEQEKVMLHFGGVDCLAQYFLNGAEIGTSSNMFVEVMFDITDKMRKGENSLAIRIRSAVNEVYDKDFSAYLIQNGWAHDTESVFLRKAPHSYGWDIMPRAVSAGIWKEVNLIVKNKSDINQIFCSVKSANEQSAAIRFSYELEIAPQVIKKGAELEIVGHCGESTFSARQKLKFKAGRIDISIQNPKLWWPKGYGEADLYHTVVKLFVDGKVVCEKELNVGIRTVELIRTDTTDGVNGAFQFQINHTDIMCRGSNWVPLDAFHSREKERYPKALELLKDIGCNIVRCWGGNVYPDDCFYEFCDANGIMIWQDFSMACHVYPQTKDFYEAMEKEAAFVIQKYRNHPSLIIWAGDNECDQLYYSAGVDPKINHITREILPRMVELHDTGRPYLASSPYLAPVIFESKRPDLCPEDHLWGPRDYFKSSYYTKSKAHFISEIGYHGCPSEKSIEKFIEKDSVWPYQNNRQWNLHSTMQNNEDSRVMLMAKQIKQLFGTTPENLTDFSFASQASQAEAKKFFIENVRCNKPSKTGVIWWNLLDGWPQMSDAVVDYYFEKKLAYDYIKRSQTPFCIMMSELSDWSSHVTAVNDTLTVMEGSVTVTDADTKKIVFERNFSVGKNAKIVLGDIPVMYSEQKLFVIRWEIGGETFFNHYVSGFPPFSLERYRKWYEEILSVL
jgi:Beta-galactosidase/beta-glucuronidase